MRQRLFDLEERIAALERQAENEHTTLSKSELRGDEANMAATEAIRREHEAIISAEQASQRAERLRKRCEHLYEDNKRLARELDLRNQQTKSRLPMLLESKAGKI